MTLLKIVAGIGLLYLVGVLLIALMEDRLLSPRWAMRGGTVPLPAAAERLTIEIADVGPLAGVFLPADQKPPTEAALLLGFGGNAWDARSPGDLSQFGLPDTERRHIPLSWLRAERGSAERRCHPRDATRIYDEVVATRDPERIVVIGLSLGSGPAAHLASRRSPAGLILVKPFDSV